MISVVKFTTLLAMLLLAVVPQHEALRILGIYPTGAHSHNAMFRGMMEVLAVRGHSVVALSPFPRKTPLANYTDLDLSSTLPQRYDVFDYHYITSGAWRALKLIRHVSVSAGNELCRATFSTQHFRDVMSGKHGRFDALITETHGSDCFSAVAHKLGIPLIGMTPLPDMPYMHDRMGSVNNPSFMPNIYEPLGSDMNFWQRARNTISMLTFQILHKMWMIDGSDAVVREFLGEDMPPLADIIRNTSLIFVNRHNAIEWPRPQNPNMVNVGGLHVKRAWRGQRNRSLELDPSLLSWLDGADGSGVILFTTGSLLKVSTLPGDVQDGIFEALGNLTQRVLFKYEKNRENLPPNVRIAPWVNQEEILAHPKVVLFITHCGLMGTQEAIVVGVPFVCIPMFSDQYHNAVLYLHQGIAEVVDHTDFRKETLETAVKQVLSDSRYRRRAQELSRRYLDRPLAVDEEAVYWVEYVVRHGGARHLRPHSADLPLHQYLLLDVAAAALAVLAVLVALVWLSIRAVLTRLTRCRAKPAAGAREDKKRR